MEKILFLFLLIFPADLIPDDWGRPLLEFIWVAGDISDPKGRAGDYRSDLEWTRRHLLEAMALPPSGDLGMFQVDEEVMKAWQAGNRDFQDNMEWIALNFPTKSAEAHSARYEAAQLALALSELEMANNCRNWLVYRRQALGRYRDLVGYENYYRGFIPAFIPVWRLAKN